MPHEQPRRQLSRDELIALTHHGRELLTGNDLDSAIRVLQEPASVGVADAMLLLSIAHMKRGSVDEAIAWGERADKAGSPAAAGVLGGHVFRARGDVDSARRWLAKAAEAGDKDSAEALRDLALDPRSEAARIIASAKEREGRFHSATSRLDLAVENWLVAAAAGSVGAMYSLGVARLDQRNIGEGMLWLEQAADKGHKEAPRKLAEVHRMLRARERDRRRRR